MTQSGFSQTVASRLSPRPIVIVRVEAIRAVSIDHLDGGVFEQSLYWNRKPDSVRRAKASEFPFDGRSYRDNFHLLRIAFTEAAMQSAWKREPTIPILDFHRDREKS